MTSLLVPNLYINSIFDLDLERLLSLGIRGLIFDLDNTIVRWGTSEITADLLGLMAKARSLGFKLCLLSNNFKERSQRIADALGIKAIGGALKPSRRGFRRAIKLMGLTHTEVAVVGDQIFTDILGGNRTGVFTILVKPLWEREFFSTRVVRRIERSMLSSFERKGRLKRILE